MLFFKKETYILYLSSLRRILSFNLTGIGILGLELMIRTKVKVHLDLIIMYNFVLRSSWGGIYGKVFISPELCNFAHGRTISKFHKKSTKKKTMKKSFFDLQIDH